jgi:ATP-dependent DNA helicase RecG
MAGFAAKTMIYRGLGSGIVRAMREDNHIDFDVSANQFKVTIWRTTQNNKSSTQKKPLKDSNTIQKDSNTIQKSDTTTQKKPLKDSRTIQKDSALSKRMIPLSKRIWIL